MYDNILVPTDGSEQAATAGGVAITLAEAFDAQLHAVFVQETERWPFRLDDDETVELRRYGDETVSAVADQAAEAGVRVRTRVLGDRGTVHGALLEYADGHDIDAIVMGTHGRTGVSRMLIGSVTEQLLRESTVPTVTVHEETVFEWPVEEILVPTDGSETAHAALSEAIELATVADAAIHLIHVVDTGLVTGDIDGGMILEALEQAGKQALDSATDRVAASGVRTVESSVVSGPPSRAICAYADERDIDAIVMGTHGRGGVERVLLGSVAERVIRRSELPVFATKATAEE